MANRARVLVVDDEAQIRRALRVALRANGYDVEEAETGEEALDAVATRPPDLVILDLGLPDLDGVEVCRRLREWSRLPIVVLSAHGDDAAKVRALDEGADDYVTKPFSMPELLARMRVALRHAAASGETGESVIRAGDVEIDLGRRIVTRAGQEVHLTPTEYKLLATLVRHSGKVLTHRQLLHEVWGTNYEGQAHYLRVYMAQLRQKLERDSARPRLLVTEPGVGYRLTTRD